MRTFYSLCRVLPPPAWRGSSPPAGSGALLSLALPPPVWQGGSPPLRSRRFTLARAAVARIAGQQPPRWWRRLTPFPVARRTTHAISHSAGISSTPSNQRVRQAAVTACGAACSGRHSRRCCRLHSHRRCRRLQTPRQRRRCRRARHTPPPQWMGNLLAIWQPTHGKGTQAAATSTRWPHHRMNEHNREHQIFLGAVRHPVPPQCPLKTNVMQK